MTSFSFNGLGLSIGAKLVQTNDRQAFIFFNNIQAFSQRGRKNKFGPHFARSS